MLTKGQLSGEGGSYVVGNCRTLDQPDVSVSARRVKFVDRNLVINSASRLLRCLA